MATDIQNTNTILEALADFAGKSLSNEQKKRIVENLTGAEGDLTTLATAFLQTLLAQMKKVMANNAEAKVLQQVKDLQQQIATLKQQARDGAKGDL
jgi:hypothetical protein